MSRSRIPGSIYVKVLPNVGFSIRLGEIVDGARAVVRRIRASYAEAQTPQKVRIAQDVIDAEVLPADVSFAEAERALLALGFRRVEARAMLDRVRPTVTGREAPEIVAAALRTVAS